MRDGFARMYEFRAGFFDSKGRPIRGLKMGKTAIIGIMAAVAAVHAAERPEVARAEALVKEINESIGFGVISGGRVRCMQLNGLRFSYRGKNYVADLNSRECTYTDYIGDGQSSLCLEVDGVRRTGKLCDCTKDGNLKCH